MDCGCTNNLVTIIQGFIDFAPIQTTVNYSNEEAFKVVYRGCMRTILTSKNEKKAISKFGVSEYSSDRHQIALNIHKLL